MKIIKITGIFTIKNVQQRKFHIKLILKDYENDELHQVYVTNLKDSLFADMINVKNIENKSGGGGACL